MKKKKTAAADIFLSFFNFFSKKTTSSVRERFAIKKI